MEAHRNPRRRRFSAGATDRPPNANGNSNNNSKAAAPKHRPQVYLNLEFGLSLSGHPPNTHSLTYQSRGSRPHQKQRSAAMPTEPRLARAAPAAASAPQPEIRLPSYDDYYYYQFLHNRSQHRRDDLQAAWESLEQQRLQQWYSRQQQHHYDPHHSPHHHRSHSRHHSNNANNGTGLRPSPIPEGSPRSSRDGRSSWERGHSAPPPLSDVRWEGPGEGPWGEGPSRPRPGPSTTVPTDHDTGNGARRSAIWKPLPEIPTSYRMSDGPWLTGPDADPDDERLRRPRDRHSHQGYQSYHPWSASTDPDDGDSLLHPLRSRSASALGFAPSGPSLSDPASFLPPDPLQLPPTNMPTVLPIQAPPRTAAARSLNVDPQRERELEALSAAMATVDNGFENQWWNQGGRAPLSPMRAVSLGWAVASPTHSPQRQRQQQQQQNYGRSPPLPSTPPAPGITRANSDYVVSAMTVSPSSSTSGAMSAHAYPHRDNSLPLRSVAVSPDNDDDSVSFPESPAWNRPNRTMSTRSEELFLTGGRFA